MILLGIDTTTDSVSVALADGKQILAHSEALSERRHVEALTPMIDFVCRQAGVSFAEIGAVAVDVGPGLFTGMRVGITSAKAIAHSLDLPIIAVSSLDVLAACVSPRDFVVASVIDARRGELYWAMYRVSDGALTQVRAPRVGPVSELVIDVCERSQSTVFVGNGALRYRPQIIEGIGTQVQGCEFADEQFARPTAATLLSLAHERVVNEEWQSAAEVVPIYLRAPDAQINWAARSAS